MSSVCMSRCVNDTVVPSRVRATYVNLHRWPESDAEFVRSLSFRSTSSGGSGRCGPPKVVDSISCRQMYLRSYTFTRRKESVNERTIRCIGKVKDRVVPHMHGKSSRKNKSKNYDDWGNSNNNNKGMSSFVRASEMGIKRVKEVPCSAFKCLFKKLLFCAASVDVVDVND